MLEKQGFQLNPVIVGDYTNSKGETISIIFAKTPLKSRQDYLSETSLYFITDILNDQSVTTLKNVTKNLRQQSRLSLQ